MNIFTPQGRFIAPIHMKLGVADGHMSPLGCAKFHLNRCRGWESGPKNIKNFHFVDTPPDRFLKCLGAFIRPTILIATCLSDTMFPRFADLLASTCEHYATFERRLLMTWLKQWLFHLFTLASTMLTLSFTDPLTSEGCSAYRTQLPGLY